MIRKVFSRLIPVTAVLTVLMPLNAAGAGDCPRYLDQEFRKLHSSETVNLCTEYGGRPLLIVNTASHCGYTPQFKGLEALHERYRARGLVVLGFPSNDFFQAAENEEKAAEVCFINYGVTFTMLSPISVKGPDAHPLFEALARLSRPPTWNFNKYLVHPSGQVVDHFNSNIAPNATVLVRRIEELL